MGRSKFHSLAIATPSAKSLVLSGLFFFFLVVGFVYSGQELQRHLGPNVKRELLAPPAGIEHFHFGFRYSMADSFWVRAIQDFDYCDQELAKHLCVGRGWLFQTLDTVTNLDPYFRMVYSAGGMALSVIISDIQGASLLFEKGVRYYPKDWIIAYKAAYNALYEEKDTPKAAALMRKAAQNGAPDWVYVLSGRLYTDAGRREFAEQVLHEMEATGIDVKLQERLRQKIMENAGPSASE